jgi:hypothetical protein
VAGAHRKCGGKSQYASSKSQGNLKFPNANVVVILSDAKDLGSFSSPDSNQRCFASLNMTCKRGAHRKCGGKSQYPSSKSREISSSQISTQLRFIALGFGFWIWALEFGIFAEQLLLSPE